MSRETEKSAERFCEQQTLMCSVLFGFWGISEEYRSEGEIRAVVGLYHERDNLYPPNQ